MDVLLYFAVLGVTADDGEETYIYNVRYDMKRLRALAFGRRDNGIIFVINKAFWRGLGIKA